MDIEHLNKSQLILLTLLVSFVTSIATGIVTVSLMEQAPPTVAQTVNRVIERTVEKVVPATEGQAAAAVVTTEKTVVVKESDLIVQAVEKVSPSLVRLYTGTSTESASFLALGIVVDDSGVIATDAAALKDADMPFVSLADGATVRAEVASREEGTGIAFLRAATSTTAGKAVRWDPVTVFVGSPVLGQTVIALSGRSIPRISDGLVVALMPREKADSLIDTNISADFVMTGSPLVNTDGALVGISTGVSRASSQSGFIPASALVKPKSGERADAEDSE